MSLPQQKFREMVLQLLYSTDIGHSAEEDMIPLIMKELSVTKKSVKEAQEKVREILKNKKSLDKTIADTTLNYEFERIQSVERNILRLGAYELLYDESIPPKVAIAEALRLARKFGTPESAAFVNAVLDHIFKRNQGLEVEEEEMQEAAEALNKSEEIAKEASLNPSIETEDHCADISDE